MLTWMVMVVAPQVVANDDNVQPRDPNDVIGRYLTSAM